METTLQIFCHILNFYILKYKIIQNNNKIIGKGLIAAVRPCRDQLRQYNKQLSLITLLHNKY